MPCGENRADGLDLVVDVVAQHVPAADATDQQHGGAGPGTCQHPLRREPGAVDEPLVVRMHQPDEAARLQRTGERQGAGVPVHRHDRPDQAGAGGIALPHQGQRIEQAARRQFARLVAQVIAIEPQGRLAVQRAQDRAACLGHRAGRTERGPAAGRPGSDPEIGAVKTDRDGLIGVDLIAQDREGPAESVAIGRHPADGRGTGGQSGAKPVDEGVAIDSKAGNEGKDGGGRAGRQQEVPQQMSGGTGAGVTVQGHALRAHLRAIETQAQQRHQTVAGAAHADLPAGRTADHGGAGKCGRYAPRHVASEVQVGRTEAKHQIGAEAGPVAAQRFEIRRRRDERPRPHRNGSLGRSAAD